MPSQLVPWPEGSPKRASINNFGYGGTNAHVIMEAAKLRGPTNGFCRNGIANGSDRSRVYVLSAKEETAVKTSISNLKAYLRRVKTDDEPAFLDNLAYTLSERRSVFDWTASAPARSLAGLISALDEGELKPIRATNTLPRLGFVFTGQGAQWYGMGRELIDAYPLFADSLREADRYLREFGASYSLMGKQCR